jgi:hypothetical protein
MKHDPDLPAGYIRDDGIVYEEATDGDGQKTYVPVTMRTAGDGLLVEGDRGYELHFFSRCYGGDPPMPNGGTQEVVLPLAKLDASAWRPTLGAQGFLVHSEMRRRLGKFLRCWVKHLSDMGEVY